MKPPHIEIPGLDTTADYGKWEDYPSPCDTLDSALDSALKTPEDGINTLHAPIWAANSQVASKGQLSQERLNNSFRKLGYMGNSPSVHEPFGILGNRQPYFLGLKSPGMYEQFIQADPTSLSNLKYDETQIAPSQRRVLGFKKEDVPPVPPLPKDLNQTKLVTSNPPSRAASPRPKASTVKLAAPTAPMFKGRGDILTFFAVWDPETKGMATFSGAQLPNRPTKAKGTAKGLPANPKAGVQQKPLPNGQHVKNNSAPKDLGPARPLPVRSASEPTKLSPQPLSMRRRANGGDQAGDKTVNRSFTIVDDEGFFENPEFFSPQAFNALDLPGHDDCDPHLPSRFSTSTTSTSNYIDIDFPPEHSARQFARSALDRHAKAGKKFGSLGTSFESKSTPDVSRTNVERLAKRSKSPPPSFTNPKRELSPSASPTGEKGRPRIPSLLDKLKRGSKNDKDGWVSVEVMTVLREDM